MKFFRCDKCKLTFQSELEQISWKQNGVERVIDVCPLCRDAIKDLIATYRKGILNPIYENK